MKNLPKSCMPREKLLTMGASALCDVELLAIFLRTGIKGENVLMLAERLLSEFGSIDAILSAKKAVFCEYKGLGEAKFVQLQAVLELSKRYLIQQITTKNVLNDLSATIDYLMMEFKGLKRETFIVLYLDSQNKLINKQILFEGTIDQAHIYPRELVKVALECGASSVILSHNHPSGLSHPSQEDRKLTEAILKVLNLLSISLLDHIIIGNGEFTSFKANGWIN